MNASIAYSLGAAPTSAASDAVASSNVNAWKGRDDVIFLETAPENVSGSQNNLQSASEWTIGSNIITRTSTADENMGFRERDAYHDDDDDDLQSNLSA